MAIRIKDFQSLVPKDFAKLFAGEGVPDALTLAYAELGKADVERRRLPFIASDDSVDLHDEIVGPGAFAQDIGLYQRNPVILAQHQHRLASGESPVVGSAHELNAGGSPFTAVVEFAEPPADRHHWALYRDGHQRAFSVGFYVKDTEKRDSRTVITRGLLLEISAVPVPANSNALVMNFVLGRLAGAAAASGDAGESGELRAAYAEISQELAALRKELHNVLGIGGEEKSAPGDGAADDDAEGMTELEQDEINACLGLS